jgi:parallel beta-helix repeat protein
MVLDRKKPKKKKKLNVGMLALIVIFVLSLFSTLPFATSNPDTTYYVPDDFEKIQWAINNATAGDTILVYSGTYYENVYIDKQLNLQGFDDGNGTPVVDAGGVGSAIGLFADGINLEGFVIRRGDIGIEVMSNNNHLINNFVESNERGIVLSYSSNNNLSGNFIAMNTVHFGIEGDDVNHFLHAIDTTNEVDGKPIYYVVAAPPDLVIDASSGAGYVGIINSVNVTIRDLELTNNGEGVLFFNTSNSVIENVTAAAYSGYGLSLIHSNDNTLINNTANSTFNGFVGISLDYSNNNTLINNIANSNWDAGISLSESTNNTLINNTANSNYYHGIVIYSSSGNNLAQNEMNSNNYNFALHGSYDVEFDNEIYINNTVDGKPIY